jgi:hypothetical protein
MLTDQPIDFSFEGNIPTFACICGSAMFKITVMWDEQTRAVGWYDLLQECAMCGATSTAPTEIDKELDCE